MLDLTACVNVVKHAGRVAVVGYCWGGTLAYLSARELPVVCAVAYYGGQIKDVLDKPPRRPVMYHFGEKDPHIPMSDVAKIRAVDPNGIFHVYPADHGFNCEERGSYDAGSARLARERTLAFLAAQMEKK
jgi:carboxymethylenebutenolidase